jgi:CHAT domain-containing protein/tetratricopeptide (TPR) repeat protein
LVVVVWIIQKPREPSINQLIARAYTQQRPFELRISDAAYGPLRQERAGEHSSFNQPTDLLRAKYLIKEALTSRPDDETLLAASGRIELLEGHYEEAIRTFGRLLDAKPDSPALLTDLATAYFQRAEAAGRAVDYGQAIELLGRALARKPDDSLALFNRAIALEKMYAYNEATRDWEHYLRVDPSGDWAAEARRRLRELQDHMKARDKPAALLRTDPFAATPLLRARATSHATFSVPWAVSLDEEYLALAVREWLPSLYASAHSPNQRGWQRDQSVWDALNATADVLRTHHKDPWLADLLRDLPGDSAPSNALGQFARGLDVLAQAVKANESGDPDAAQPLAESAARFFRDANSNPGFLRAREEIIYSLSRAGREQDCIQAARQQLRVRRLDSYVWLKAQATLWHATCQERTGNLDLAQRLSERALELTKSTGYTGQHLRSILFASGFLHSTERNWQYTRAGVQKFWSDLYNPFHAYESYVELAILAEEADKWHLALHLRREALGMIERTPDRSFRAVAHYRVAVAAMRVEDLPEAQAEFRIASEQLAALPQSRTARLYKTESDIHLAAVEVQQGKLDSAAARLEQASLRLADVSDNGNKLLYYQALGQLHFRRRNLRQAEQALRNALRIGENELRSIQTDADRLAWEREAAPAYRTLVDLYAQQPDATTRALEVWEWYRGSASRGSVPSLSGSDPDPGNLDTGTSASLLVPVGDTIPAFKHETVISFAFLPSGVAAWAFDDRGVNFAWVGASGEELASRVRNFVQLCRDPSSDLTKLRQQGRNLYDLLVAPFERHLEPSRLLIVEPDSNLSDVPWPALVDPRGEYLGSRLAIIVSPGLGYWLNLRSAATISPEETALVVGMPALASAVASRFSPLPDADREARRIASKFRHSRLLSGTEVTSQAIRQELPHSSVFHFAGHAVTGGIQSGLVLTSLNRQYANGDETTLLSAGQLENDADEVTLLSADDLEKALLQRLQLVVLSACATAETEKGFTEPGTLVRGFLRAGVPHVVASRWPVDSQTTEQTMAGLYSGLFAGLPAAQALQQAADKLRLQPATSHPYYWAAFDSYGR